MASADVNLGFVTVGTSCNVYATAFYTHSSMSCLSVKLTSFHWYVRK